MLSAAILTSHSLARAAERKIVDELKEDEIYHPCPEGKWPSGPCNGCGKANVKSGRERGVYFCVPCLVRLTEDNTPATTEQIVDKARAVHSPVRRKGSTKGAMAIIAATMLGR